MMMFDTCKEPDLCIVYGEPIRPKPIIHKRTEGQQKAHPVEQEEDVTLFRGGSCRASWEITVQTIPGAAKEQDVCIVGEENIWQCPSICVRKVCLQESHSVEDPVHSKLDSSVPSEPPVQTVVDAAKGQDIGIVYEEGVLQKPTIHIRTGYPEETHPREDIDMPIAGGGDSEGHNESTFQPSPDATKEQNTCVGYEEMVSQKPIFQGRAPIETKGQRDMDAAGVVQWTENIRKSLRKAQDEMVEQNYRSHDGPSREKGSHTEWKTDESIIPQSGFFTEQGEQPENRGALRTSTEEKTIQRAESGGISSGSRNNGNSPTCPMEVKPFTCLECGMSFRKQKQFAVHQMIHTGEKPHKCAHCGKSFRTKTQLTGHERIHTGEKPHKCAHCGKSFHRKSDLTVHERIHTGEKPHKCAHCVKSFYTKRDLKEHERLHTREKPFKCLECDKSFIWRSSLTIHKRTHTKEKPFKCSVCNRCFSQRSNLTRHQSIHKGERPHECSVCGKCFSQEANLTKHLKLHTRKTPFKLSMGKKIFTNSSNLLTQQMIRKKKYKCSARGKSYTKWSYLTKHKRIPHKAEKPYKCSECRKCFSSRSALTRHKRIIHRWNKVYVCSKCSQYFRSRRLLITHQGSHTAQKPFQCSECRKAFSQEANLLRHQRTHTGEKPYKCPVCRKSFSESAGLSRHTRSCHTVEKLYNCEQCGKSFTRKSNLKRHQKHHTRETPNQGSNLSESLGDESRPHEGENAQQMETM